MDDISFDWDISSNFCDLLKKPELSGRNISKCVTGLEAESPCLHHDQMIQIEGTLLSKTIFLHFVLESILYPVNYLSS